MKTANVSLFQLGLFGVGFYADLAGFDILGLDIHGSIEIHPGDGYAILESRCPGERSASIADRMTANRSINQQAVLA